MIDSLQAEQALAGLHNLRAAIPAALDSKHDKGYLERQRQLQDIAEGKRPASPEAVVFDALYSQARSQAAERRAATLYTAEPAA